MADNEPSLPLRRHLIANAVVLAPTVIVLGVMAVAGWLPVWHAMAAMAAIGCLTAIVVRRYLHSFVRFSRYVETLARGEESDVPRFVLSPAAEELATGVQALDGMWRRQREAIAGLQVSAQTIVDGLPDPLFAVDRRRRLVRWNRAASDLVGTPTADRDLSATVRHPALLDAIDAALEAQAPIDTAIVELALAGPPERVFSAHVKRLPRATADGSLALIVLHDISALRRAERMRADFVANASHELRTPLAGLVGFVETLRGPARDDPEARARFLAIMAEQTDRMRRLVEDLLSLSRIEQREHEPPTARVDVAGVLRGVRDLIDMKARQRGVTVAFDIPDDLPAVTGDADELTMVFQNLADNAVKYTAAGTAVRVVAKAGDGWVRVHVVDQGEGIASEHVARLTERFYRVDTARSREMGGTGLGLAIVKHALSRHRGRLEIDSEPGRGSTFTVVLPVALPSQSQGESRPVDPA
ncbi:MAG: PAS domain-containing protein [Alphaproteobacteria bacterium]|nr:PAS domain-containing protein [Alphaproteobacteria bacterium]